MAISEVRRVAIIGAGVAGLATARMLQDQRIECTIFERNSRLGGVWAIGYSNFGVQVPKALYEYPDWPLPADTPDFTPGEIFQRYLEDYARHFGVYEHICFGAEVLHVEHQQEPGSGWAVTFRQSGTEKVIEFDMVVMCVGLFSHTPYVPEIPGREHFAGQVIHNSELETNESLRGKKVIVVGYGKSASDAALEALPVATNTSIVFRQAHWPAPRKLAGVLPYQFAMHNRLMSTLIPPYYRPSRLENALHTVGKPAVWLWWRLVELLLIIQCGLWAPFSRRPNLVPSVPVEYDLLGERTMVPRPEFYAKLRKRKIASHKCGVRAFDRSGLLLDDDTHLEADVVIFGTGWKTDYSFLSQKTLDVLNIEDDGYYLYRQIVHPEIANMAFIGITATYANIVTYSIQARWLAELIRGTHQLPSREVMLDNIEEVKRWKRKVLPFSASRGARLQLHLQHYHDELLRDIGVEPHLKKGFLAPVKEVFAPYFARDYAGVVSGSFAA